MLMTKRMRSNLLLLLTAFIWGTAFVAQKKGVDTISPNTFNGIRQILGCLALLPVIAFREKKEKLHSEKAVQSDKKSLMAGGIVCGICLCAASTTQTAGLVYTDAGKGGFITAMYIVIVPIIGFFTGKKIRPSLIVAVAVATCGLYLLCMGGGTVSGGLNRGDMLLILCAVLFSVHILVVDRVSPHVDGVKLSFIQFFVSGMINIVFMLLFDKPDFAQIFSCAVPLLYAGVMSCGVAYTLQIVAQKDTDPTVASILMSMESLFALLAGLAFGEKMSIRGFIGCALMMTAIILAQLPEKKSGDKI